ncbi:DEAD/DEAH box helicase [Nannocystis sp. ILAH1]|uniref:DEAD/DEAH box helicase n=1 Tax=Nannocystis sp. ILAH1 TaxID=2996789 RepID=UPI002270EF3B|nr:DEAD/DEAH box helicase [Nannocystis sp. ILAH1]MCY0989465.1 DEAD/DEAH box helicase [Nannocystis sp. ILAH1]
MDVFTLRDQVLDDYQGYIRSFLTVRDHKIAALVERELREGHLWPKPLLQINPAFESGDRLDELIADGTLHAACDRIFRDKPDPDVDRGPLGLYRHQVDGIRAGRAGDPFVVTTGTGSGKSLSYIVPIVDHVLRERQNSPERRIRAIIVYPMNALANSQKRELEKFLEHGYPDGPPVTFRCYTGQEKPEKRKEILQNPPDILLTNFVMLELILTRHDERRLIDAAQGLRFLVLDELHTYRGRQGADVALLVRRVREACRASDLVCIGTSATLAASGTWREQQTEVARVASLIFGAAVRPQRVIGEHLRRRTSPLDLDDPTTRALLRARVEQGPTPSLDAEDPLAAWIESALGLDLASDGRLVRRKPRTLEDVADELARELDLPPATCTRTLAAALLAKTAEARPFFALRVHQFLSKGDTVYAVLQPEQERHLTLYAQQFAPGSGGAERLYPLVFCRECGQEYYAVIRRSNEQGVTYLPRPRDLPDNPDTEIGYLYLNTSDPWPDHPDDLPRLPDAWIESKDGKLRLRRERRDDVPRPCFVAPDGREGHGNLRVHYLRAPFRFCLQCGVQYSAHARSDFGKLATLGTEGRSTATTLLSLSTVRRLRRTKDLDPVAQKLLSFTDNRQDASLQAGHFNDFVHIAIVRSALWRAVAAAGPAGLTHENLTDAVFRALGLPLALYASNPQVEYRQREETDRALRRVLGYHVYRDLKRGWRLVAPNLEQSGLLVLDYSSLAEFSADTPKWTQHHPALVRAHPEQRQQICRILLDHLRRELAIRVEYLDEARRDALLQMSSQYLNERWRIDDFERHLELASVAFPCGEHPRIRHPRALFVSPRGGFARFVRHSLRTELKTDDLEHILGEIFEALLIPGLLDRVQPARDGAPPGYMVAASGLIWRAGDGEERSWDPMRVPQPPSHGLRPNEFFTNFYRGTNHDLHTLEAREHTAQVSNAERQEREDRFRSAELPILYCSPTMELGVDIRDLNVVNMRNIPPTPANYAQRSGRAGRSGQPAFIYTYCTATSPHDQYFFRRPEKMVAGVVSTPRIDLGNEDLLRAHVHAIWVAEADLDLGDSLGQILDIAGDRPTLRLLPHVEAKLADQPARERAHRRAATALQDALRDYLAHRGISVDGWLGDIFSNLRANFDAACDRWRSLFATAKAQLQRQHKIAEDHSRPAFERDQAKRLREEADRQLSLLVDHDPDQQHSDFYPYRYFACEGFLPGYNFPRLPLSAYLPGARKRRRGQRDDEYLSRPRFLAISEFGPRAFLYHEGSRYVINRVLLSADSAEGARRLKVRAALCQACGYLHQLTDEPAPDLCVRCHARLGTPFTNLFRMRHVAARRRDRITCDEEERQRLGYELKTGVQFAGQQSSRPDARAAVLYGEDNVPLADLIYGHAATVWRINLGWRRRKPDQPLGFELDTERGYWARSRPDQDDDPDPDDPASPQQERVIPYVDDTRNCLLLRPIGSVDDALMASLQAALKTSIQLHFQLEDRELAAEPLPSTGDRQQILFYEASEGGAGVLRQLVEDEGKRALAKVAETALELCHFDVHGGVDQGHAPGARERCEAACYDCLLSYSNQYDHPILDRKLLPELLLRWSKGHVRFEESTPPSSQGERTTSLAGQSTSDLERRFLDLLVDLGLALPDAAQKHLAVGQCIASFFYSAHGLAVFIDDASHDSPAQARLAQAATERLEDAGYGVLRFHHATDWTAILRANPSIFGTGSTNPRPTTAPAAAAPQALTSDLDLDLYPSAWHPVLQELAGSPGVTIEPGSEVTDARGRVIGSFIATLARGPALVHLVDAADSDSSRVQKALTAANATVVALTAAEANALGPDSLLARVFA